MNSHELNSTMLLVHPPLAIAGYLFIFIFTIALFSIRNREKRTTSFLGLTGWLFTLFGLVTGMIWAEIAWGSYWSWDPKENLTLILFLSVSASQLAFFEKKLELAKWISLLSCTLSIITLLSSFIITGLHSFG